MRQLPSDKYNVAWFKLAEFVVRGEKERALGIYRLLVHSFDDHALALQLEGDLLLSFNDIEAAKEKYILAAQAYIKIKKLIEAAAVYEHLHTLASDQEEFLLQLLELYQEIAMTNRFALILKQLSELYLKKNLFDKVVTLFEQHELVLEIHQKADIYALITFHVVKQKNMHDQGDIFLLKTLDLLMESSDTQQLPNFLMKLDSFNTEYYKKALSYIKE